MLPAVKPPAAVGAAEPRDIPLGAFGDGLKGEVRIEELVLGPTWIAVDVEVRRPAVVPDLQADEGQAPGTAFLRLLDRHDGAQGAERGRAIVHDGCLFGLSGECRSRYPI